MVLKEKDFIEINYTGRIIDDNVVFDTTDEKIAKENDIFTENAKYGPVAVCLGKGHLLKGLDEFLVGKDIGKYEVEIKAEDAFGKKSAKLLKLIPSRVFKKDKINPFPGLEVDIDGTRGIIRNVSGGRVIVDFNHPLSGKDMKYQVEVKKIITDVKEKVLAFFKTEMNFSDVEVVYDGTKKEAKITSVLPNQIADQIGERIKDLIPEIKTTVFIKKEENNDKKEDAPAKKIKATQKSEVSKADSANVSRKEQKEETPKKT